MGEVKVWSRGRGWGDDPALGEEIRGGGGVMEGRGGIRREGGGVKGSNGRWKGGE